MTALTIPNVVIRFRRDLTNAERVLAAARGRKHLRLIPGAGHNDSHLIGRSAYFAALREFLAELEAP